MSQRTIILPDLKKWQQDVFDELADGRYSGKRVIVKSKRQTGKSILAEILLIKYCLEKKCTSIMLSPTLNQSRKVFKDICNMLSGSGAITSNNASLLTLDFCNGSQLLFKSGEQRESLRGYTVDGILIIDEAAYIQDDIFEIVYPFCDANNAPMLILSTPLFKDGEFYRLYSNADNIRFDWSEYDTSEFLTPERLEYYRSILTENKFKSEYLGLFIEDGGYVFRGITNCFKTSTLSPVSMGIDWGSGNGNDYTAITMLDANSDMVYLDYFNNVQPTEQIDLIADLINKTPTLTNVTVEQNSIGNVYYDFLLSKINKKSILHKFSTTNESKRRIVENLANAIANQKIGLINEKELIKELQHYAQEKTKTGYTYNGVGGVHDDIVMSLAICYDIQHNNTGNYILQKNFKKHKTI